MHLPHILAASIFASALGAYQATLVQAKASDVAVPSSWEPSFWDKGMLAAKEAQARGDRAQAESLCARVVPYAEAQGVKALFEFAELFESKKSATAASVRARAGKLAEIKAS